MTTLPPCYRCGKQPCLCADGITLYYDDARRVLPLLEPGSVDLVLTDPPYLLHAGRAGGCFGDRDHLAKTGGFTDGGCNFGFLDAFSNWFCFCSRLQLPELLHRAAMSARWNLVTWCKPNPVPTCNNKYLPDVEFIVHVFQAGRLFGDMAVKSSFMIHPCGRKETEHPNEKPIALIRKLVSLGSRHGETVLDPFAGSGTTGRACKDLGRKCILIEIELKYVEIAARRLQQEVLPLHD